MTTVTVRTGSVSTLITRCPNRHAFEDFPGYRIAHNGERLTMLLHTAEEAGSESERHTRAAFTHVRQSFLSLLGSKLSKMAANISGNCSARWHAVVSPPENKDEGVKR